MPKTVNGKVSTTFDSYHVGIAAESFAAGLLAHAGYEVLVQYGANQPLYDLVAVKGKRILKVSVKGSSDGDWGLIQNFLTGEVRGDKYHKAADEWLIKHGSDTVFVFVQFLGVALGQMPEFFVARADAVGIQLKSAKNKTGDSVLRRNHTWTRGIAKGCTDTIPQSWKFTQERIDSV
jgi:Holliday junction resolvase-like predicted endonuclease